MKRLILILPLFILLTSCSGGEENFKTKTVDGLLQIQWEGRTYESFAGIPKSDLGERIGTSDEGDVYTYKNKPKEEWLAVLNPEDKDAILLKEEKVEEIPEELRLKR